MAAGAGPLLPMMPDARRADLHLVSRRTGAARARLAGGIGAGAGTTTEFTMIDAPSDPVDTWRRQQDEARALTQRHVAQWLADHPHIVRIEAEYNGSGDGGDVESVTLTLADGTTSEDIPDGLEDLLWSIAYDAHPGFENNAGGFGTVVIEGGKVRIEHSWYVEITEDDDPIEWTLS